MLQKQKEFLDYLDGVRVELDKADSSFEDIQKNVHALEGLKQEIGEAELIVPVVGAFSAGKSTLINSFLGSGLLPVDVTPETALATELRYCESEYIEAIKDNDETDRYAIGEIGVIKERAGQYQYVKVFLNSEQLREIAPLVLVDMPGFDSPLDLHQRAILAYLERGSYYMVLISVTAGTVTRSTHRQLSDFHKFNKTFSLFLSKKNLKPDSEVRAIAQNIEERLKSDFGYAGSVFPVGKEGGESLKKMLKAIDPEKLFGRIWRSSLESHFFAIDESLNTRISALKKDEGENQEAIDKLDSALRNLQSKKEEMIEGVRAKYSTDHIKAIVEGVGVDISNSVEELTDIAMQSGGDALHRCLSENVRTSLLSHVKNEMDRLSERIAEDLSSSLKGIDSILSSYTIDDQWAEDIEQKIRIGLEQGSTFLEGIQKVAAETEGRNLLGKVETVIKGRSLYRVATTALAITTSVVAPILELVIVFLPDILVFFQKQRQRKYIRNQLIGTVIPSLQSEIRRGFSEHFNEQVNLLINEQTAIFDSQIKAKQSEIVEAERVKKETVQGIEQTISKLIHIRDNIRSLADQVIFIQ